MKKKIMIFMLLFSFLVGVGVPDQAKAAEHEDLFIESINYITDDMWEYINKYPYLFTYAYNGSNQGVSLLVYDGQGKFPVEASYKYQTGFRTFFLDEDGNQCSVKKYMFNSENWVELNNSDTYLYGGSNGYLGVLCSSFDTCNSITGIKPIGSFISYSFDKWCSDAGLNCIVSSNETEELYDFSFNSEDYYYIVRRNRIAGSRYTLYLSQVTKEEDLIYYSTNRALADSKIGAAALYVLSGESVSGSTHICNYVYDSSGGGWLYTDNYSVDLGFTNDYFVDDIGISFSSSMPIVYSSTDIYSDKEQSSVYYAADTEFEDPFVVYPNISPTSTPTPTPISNSGSSDLGGNVVAGGGIDFIISIVSQFWSRVCSIPMYVDGFQINLQQMYVYGILAGIVGGAIVLFTRRK